MDGLDWGTYYFFSESLAREMPVLTALMRAVDFAGRLPVLAVLALTVAAVLAVRRRGYAAIVMSAIFVVGLLSIEALNRAVAEAYSRRGHPTGAARPPKPDAWYADIDLGPSVVSRTTFATTLVYGALALAGASGSRRRRVIGFGVFALIIVMIGFSQLYLSLEFLTALLAGWAAGAFALVLCWQLAPLRTPQPR